MNMKKVITFIVVLLMSLPLINAMQTRCSTAQDLQFILNCMEVFESSFLYEQLAALSDADYKVALNAVKSNYVVFANLQEYLKATKKELRKIVHVYVDPLADV